MEIYNSQKIKNKKLWNKENKVVKLSGGRTPKQIQRDLRNKRKGKGK